MARVLLILLCFGASLQWSLRPNRAVPSTTGPEENGLRVAAVFISPGGLRYGI